MNDMEACYYQQKEKEKRKVCHNGKNCNGKSKLSNQM